MFFMQVSIYLDDKLVKKIDQKIKKSEESRSQFIQNILNKELFGFKKENIFDETAGILSKKEGEEMLKAIYTSRKSRKTWPIF